MIQLYCGRIGSGKTKSLIKLANEKVSKRKGNLVYIDDDDKMSYELDRNIRFISTDEFGLKNYDEFYGFLSGAISEDYDIEEMFIDGLLKITSSSIHECEELLKRIQWLSDKFEINMHINISIRIDEIPEYLNSYNVEFMK
ncbi:hypothetical protein [Oceanirhabdus sp. W0125-5]|uniref:hypothetical protein n=1 Tax=Oceanirhabdus sp. W0125-5 TaxID=2999116 RepID=UPI0022F2D5BF|nr:hypothetical protein [Oceanirhabdus sp. W0125-5]WBW98765.1 hypothetical protein OW730_08395 [Oceanirhabdus sp. W0125-5]